MLTVFFSTQGFLTDSGDVNLDRVQMIMSDLGDVEDEIFKKRQQNELAFKQREKSKKRRMETISNYKPNWVPAGQFAPTVKIPDNISYGVVPHRCRHFFKIFNNQM